jgi:hypothetical protein
MRLAIRVSGFWPRAFWQEQGGTQDSNDSSGHTDPGTQDDRDDRSGDTGFVIQFKMPAEFTLDTLPKPLDPQVRHKEVPGG